MASIPPWLDVSPASFVGAAESGRRLQQGDEQIGLEHQRLAQSAQQAAAELGMQQQELAAKQKQQAIDNQISQEQLKNQFLRTQTQQSITQAYHDALIGLGQDRITEQAKTTALAHADRLAAIQARMKPAGETMTRTTDFGAVAGTPSVPAQPAGRSYLWGAIGGRPATPAMTGTPAIDKSRVTERVQAPIGSSPVDAFRSAQPVPTNAPPVSPAPQGALPKVGDVVNGYTFKGGDPADQKNWVSAAE